MATLEGDRSNAQRAGVSYRGATSRVPDTFTEDIQAGAAVPGTTDNDLESWRAWLAERVPLDIHEHITDQIASPNGDDRFAASAEVAAGDPTRWISLRQIGQWIKANFGFHLKNDVTRQAPGISESDRLVMSDESAAGDPNSWITMAALLNWLRSRVAFDIHDDLATETTGVADDDRIPISDESVNGDPNRYVEASNLAAYVNAHATNVDLEDVRAGTALDKIDHTLFVTKPKWLSSLWGRPNADDDNGHEDVQPMRMFHLESQDTRAADNSYSVAFTSPGLSLPVYSGQQNIPDSFNRRAPSYSVPTDGTGAGEYNAARPGWTYNRGNGRFYSNGVEWTAQSAGSTDRRIDIYVTVDFPPSYFDGGGYQDIRIELNKSNNSRYGANERHFINPYRDNNGTGTVLFRLTAATAPSDQDYFDIQLAYQHGGGTRNLPLSAVTVRFVIPGASLTPTIDVGSLATIGAAPTFRGALGNLQVNWGLEGSDTASDASDAFLILGTNGQYLEALRDLRTVKLRVHARQNTHADAAGTAYLWSEIPGVSLPEVIASVDVSANARYDIFHTAHAVVRGQRFFMTMQVANRSTISQGHIGNPRLTWDARPDLGGNSVQTSIPGLIRKHVSRPAASGKASSFTIGLPDSATPNNVVQAKLLYDTHRPNGGTGTDRWTVAVDLPSEELLREGKLLVVGPSAYTQSGVNNYSVEESVQIEITVNASKQATLTFRNRLWTNDRYVVNPRIEVVHA